MDSRLVPARGAGGRDRDRSAGRVADRATHWGIVGGGMLGLTLALRLAQRGRRVTVLERADRLGGLASAWSLDGVVWDRHYHVTLLSDSHLRALLAELGLEREIEWVETRTGLFAGDRLHSISSSVDLLRLPTLGLLDKLRLAATILYASRISNWKRLEGIPVSGWLRGCSGRRNFERLWLPLLRAKLGESYAETSAAFIWATIQRLYAARRTGLKREMFGYVPGGYARILARLADRLAAHGVEVRTGCRVERVEANGGRVAVGLHGGGALGFDQVAVTAAPPVAARLCGGLTDDEQRRLGAIRYQGVVCVSLLLARPLAGYYLTYITDGTVPFTAVVEMTALVGREHFGGRSLVYLPKYVSAGDPMLGLPDAEIEERFLAALARMYPGLRREDVLTLRTSRVRHVLALPTLHYSERLPPMTSSVAGVHLVNSARIVNGTLNVNETIGLAERAAAMLSAAGRGAGGGTDPRATDESAATAAPPTTTTGP